MGISFRKIKKTVKENKIERDIKPVDGRTTFNSIGRQGQMKCLNSTMQKDIMMSNFK